MIFQSGIQSSVPDKILKSNGYWLTAARRPNSNELDLATWTEEEDSLMFKPLVSTQRGLNPEASYQGIIGNRFIIVGADNAFGICCAEYDINTGSLLRETHLGDGKNRWGGGSITSNGGFAAVIYADSSPQNKIILDSLYLPPYPLQLPGQSEPEPPNWQYHRYEFLSNTGSAMPYKTTGTWWKGYFWFFFCRDSSGQIGLTRFRIDTNGILVLDFHEAGFISGRVSGENPDISVAIDKYNDRLILGYQTLESIHGNTCPGGPWASYWELCSVDVNKNIIPLGKTSFMEGHRVFTIAIMFPRPDGIYFGLSYTNVNIDCKRGYKLGRFKNGVFEIYSELPTGKIMSFIEDGWCIYYNQTINKTELLKFDFPVVLTIKKNGSEGVIIDWNPFRIGQILEEKIGNNSWIPLTYTNKPPITIYPSNQNDLHMFRIKEDVTT